ncbi:obtusifoliol 14-alpha demethylase-like [Oryza glaberrima]|uniref:obtusifoliol 14-alpha demethylase-like n=1 Tax=Oryza glaberrima TaxID=4538 RepID=UPI00224BE8C2|nr:obtusifoliol 14-alpha demethylase-like [Oryza glaberrima]
MWSMVALCTIITAMVTTKLARVRRPITLNPKSKRPLPPVVNVIALLEHLPRLCTKGVIAVMHDLYTRFGSVFTVSLFGLKATFLVGPEVSAHFYQGMDSEISQGDLYEFTVPMFGKGVGFDIDNATRTEHLRFFIDAIKTSKLRNHVNSMVQEVEDYFAKWGENGIVDIKHEFEKLLMLISGHCLLGKEVRDNMFDEVFSLFHELDSGVGLGSVIFPYIPIPSHIRRDKAHTKLAKIFSKIVRSRRDSNRPAEQDVLQYLIDSKHRDGSSTTEQEVTGWIISMVFAGKHTSTNSTTWTGACLLTHDKFLTEALDEQKHMIQKHGDHIDYNVLLDMDILHCCIKEALRMHPVAPIIYRKAQKSFVVRTREGDAYDIPEGHNLLSPMIFNNRLPYIYKDPHMYDPDRFAPKREEDKVGGMFSYTSFGGGRHICIGEAYAYMQIKVIWSHLLRNFELKLESPFPKTNWSKILLEPWGKVMVSYKRRRLPTA